jgi:hypothetical protein
MVGRIKYVILIPKIADVTRAATTCNPTFTEAVVPYVSSINPKIKITVAPLSRPTRLRRKEELRFPRKRKEAQTKLMIKPTYIATPPRQVITLLCDLRGLDLSTIPNFKASFLTGGVKDIEEIRAIAKTVRNLGHIYNLARSRIIDVTI